MKWALIFTVLLVLGPGDAAAERAASPADATVFIRLVGSMHAEFEEAGAANQATDIERVEIGTGSGFVISPHGYILTNEHVIRNSEFVVTDGPRKAKISLKVARIDVCFPQGASTGPFRCFEASVHSSDSALDLAVLFISVSDLPYVALGDSDAVRTGQAVEALGYPFGRQLEVGRVAAPDLVPEISTSAGTISALRAGDAGDRRALQINSTINPGNSGGPVVDRDGFAVGVIRARITGNSGIGFAIPINQAKDFIESRGLDSLMPARRIRPGAIQSFDSKGIVIRLPEGMADTSPFRSRIESDPGLTGVALRIDRSFSPWTARQIERTLVGTDAFERLTVAASEGQSSSRAGGAPLLIGRATGTRAGSSADVRMQYGVLDLGAEKLVARYVGSAEQLAYNESVLRDSLASLDGQRLSTDDVVPADKVEWSAALASGAMSLPLPAGWVVEGSAPSACAGLPQASTVAAIYPARDTTLALRAAVWDAAKIPPQDAAAACASRRGSSGAASYATRAEWLGVSYSIEGAFLRIGAQQVQLEVIAPERKSAGARALLDAWIKKTSEAAAR